MMHSYSYTQNKYTCQAYRYRTRGSQVPGPGRECERSTELRGARCDLLGREVWQIRYIACVLPWAVTHDRARERCAHSASGVPVRTCICHLSAHTCHAFLHFRLCAIVPFALFEIISVYTSPITISHLRYALFTRETAPAARARTGFPCRHARYAESRRETSSPARLHSRRVAGLRVALAGRTGHLS